MTSDTKTMLFGEDKDSSLLVEGAFMPILLGGIIGLGTGALIWIMIVVRFGLMGLFWP